MAELTGKDGAITFTNITVNVFSWSLDDGVDIHDKTDFADGGNDIKTKKAGLKDWSATVESRVDDGATNTAAPGDEALLTLTIKSGKTYTGTAILASTSVNTPVDDLVTRTYNFVGNGTLTRPT